MSAATATPPPPSGQQTIARVTRLILDPSFRFPSLPSIASEVMNLANAREVTFREVDKVVRRDPLLAARVLSVANSPVFQPRTPVISLRTAMMLLGWNVLREVLWQVVAEAHVFRGASRRQLKNIRIHSVATAHITRAVCRRLGLDTEFAFVCGLLHDIGRPMAIKALAAHPDIPLDEPSTDLVDAVHAVVGERVAQAWNLPTDVVQCAGQHHNPDCEVPLVQAVRAAELLGYHFGLGERQEDLSFDDPAFGRLGLSTVDIEQLLETVDDLRTQLA